MAEVDSVIRSLIEQEVPEGRKALQDGHENLAKVATYCQQKYFEANNRYKGARDKAVREETREIFNETKQFATQSLASVAYQINTLAVNMLNLLDQQTLQLQNMESKINYISQTVNIHKEKVARREIGVLATSKNTTRTHKIIAPSKQEKPERYQRKPIDYSILDDVGHGVKLDQTDNIQRRKSSKKNPPSPAPSAPGGSIRNKPSTRIGITTKPPPPPVPPPTAPSVPANFDMTYDSIPTSTPVPPPTPPSEVSPVVTPSKVFVQPPVPPPPPPMGGGHSPPPPPFPISAPDLPAPPMEQPGQTYEPVDDIMSPPPPPPAEDFYSTPSSLALPLPPDEMQSPILPPPPSMMDDDYIEKVISLYKYEAARSDELCFEAETVIYVVKKNDDGWFEGFIEGTGNSGLFPGNYVEAIP